MSLTAHTGYTRRVLASGTRPDTRWTGDVGLSPLPTQVPTVGDSKTVGSKVKFINRNRRGCLTRGTLRYKTDWHRTGKVDRRPSGRKVWEGGVREKEGGVDDADDQVKDEGGVSNQNERSIYVSADGEGL